MQAGPSWLHLAKNVRFARGAWSEATSEEGTRPRGERVALATVTATLLLLAVTASYLTLPSAA